MGKNAKESSSTFNEGFFKEVYKEMSSCAVETIDTSSLLEEVKKEYTNLLEVYTVGLDCISSLRNVLRPSTVPCLMKVLRLLMLCTDKNVATHISAGAMIHRLSQDLPAAKALTMFGGPEALVANNVMPLTACAGALYARRKHLDVNTPNWPLLLLVEIVQKPSDVSLRKQVRWWLKCLHKGPDLPPPLNTMPLCPIDILCTVLSDSKVLKKLKKLEEGGETQNAMLRDVLEKALISAPRPCVLPTLTGGSVHVETYSTQEAFALHSKERLPFVIPLPPTTTIIVKQHDDLRQERFCIEMFRIFNRMWEEAGIDSLARVAVYDIVPTQEDSGYIEFLRHTKSIHDWKKQSGNPKSTIDDILLRNGVGVAQRSAYIGSLAASSAATYVMQVKDRHNANIMLSTHGTWIHVDFGFFLQRAPGGLLSLESAPFKMNKEMVAAMGEEGGLERCKALFVRCMDVLEARSQEICDRMEVILQGFPDFLCLDGTKPSKAVKAVRDRLKIPKKKGFKGLFEEAMDHPGCDRYDDFQRMSQGILP